MINRRKPFFVLALLVSLGIGGASAEEPVTPVPPEETEALTERITQDRLRVDIEQVLGILTGLDQITALLPESIAPADAMQTLLDPSLPALDRVRRVLDSAGGIAPETVVETASVSQEELLLLRAELEALRDQIGLLELSVHAAPPVPSGNPVPVESARMGEEYLHAWNVGRSDIQYVQLGDRPAVWLISPDGSARLGIGEVIRLSDRSIRLTGVDRPDGSDVIRITLVIDGTPRTIDWY